jgi:hypothetical protein
MIITVFGIFFIILFFFWLSKFLNTEHFNIKEYKKLMLNNNNEKLYRISLNDIPILEEDCFQKCDRENCIKLDQLKKNLDKCLKCNNTKNKCFAKSIIGGLCNDCNIENPEDKMDCLSIINYGCLNPNNLETDNGVSPYYIQIPDDNINSPYNKKCVFCWNILNEL